MYFMTNTTVTVVVLKIVERLAIQNNVSEARNPWRKMQDSIQKSNIMICVYHKNERVISCFN